MARKRKVEPANTEIIGSVTAVELDAAEAASVLSPEPTPVAAAEGAVAAPEAEKPTKRRGGRRSKNAQLKQPRSLPGSEVDGNPRMNPLSR